MMRIFVLSIGLSVLSFSAFGVNHPEIQLPKKLVCEIVGQTGNAEPHILYTRLNDITHRAQLPSENSELTLWSSEKNGRPKKDEVAFNWSGDYFQATVNMKEFRYSVWTCDSEDRFYTLSTEDLILAGTSAQSFKKVRGKLTVSIRDEEEKFDLNCMGTY